MHEQSKDNIVEKLTVKRAKEISSDEIKMSIIQMLNVKGPCSFGDILRELGISQPAGTKHILELKLLGLIERSLDPPNYNINEDRYAALVKLNS
jgi:DNA-binding MarR family transcriptional regulator